jgi:hypothetical protein
MRVDDDRVKKAMAQQLRWKFDLTTFDDGETVEDYVLCLSGMTTHLDTLNEEVKDGEIIIKMLRSLLPCFKQIMITIKTLLNVSTMPIADLTERLNEVEERFEKALMSLQQDGKLYLIKEEWDMRRKKCEAKAKAKVVGVTRVVGTAGVVGAVTPNQAGVRTSPSVMSAGAVARWGIEHASAARSPTRSMCMSCKTKRRVLSFS